jgi:hypothetical protein
MVSPAASTGALAIPLARFRRRLLSSTLGGLSPSRFRNGCGYCSSPLSRVLYDFTHNFCLVFSPPLVVLGYLESCCMTCFPRSINLYAATIGRKNFEGAGLSAPPGRIIRPRISLPYFSVSCCPQYDFLVKFVCSYYMILHSFL